MAQPDRLARALVDAAFELHRRRLWLEVPADTPIHVRVPDEPHPLLVTVMGHLGRDYGIFVVRGEHAPSDFRRYIDSESPVAIHALDLLCVTMDALAKIPTAMRGVLQNAGIQARREAFVPAFYSKPAHAEQGRGMNRVEQRIMLAVIRGLLLVHRAGELHVDELDQRYARILEITVEGQGHELTARTNRIRAPKATAKSPRLEIPEGLPRLNERWVAGTVFDKDALPAELDIERVVVVIRERSRRVLAHCFGAATEPLGIPATIAALIRGEHPPQPAGVPSEVIFADESVHAAVAPLLAGLGVRCSVVPGHELIAEHTRDLDKTLAAIQQESEREEQTDVPPKTVHEWKDADIRITRRLSKAVDADRKSVDRAAKRFFGNAKLGSEVLKSLEHLQPIASFVEWRLSDYRPTVRSKTFLEKRLARTDLSPTERTLIDARLNARISIYRILSTKPGESLEIEDVFDGTRFTIHERALSGCDVDGLCIPMRVMRVAEWHFIGMAGPPLPHIVFDRAMSMLESWGVELSPEGLGRATHLLGRLWELALPRNRRMPKITNTDGDALLWHTATFRLADPNVTARALDARKDVSADVPGGEWTWWRPGGPAPGFGDNTTLGTIEIHDQRLVLEVNSAARFARARKWIEALPGGVEFERVTTRTIDLERESTPLDDQLPQKTTPASPEMIALLERAQREASFKWLDQRVPALGNRTPREVAKSEAGRRRVAWMIRTMPSSMSPNGPIEPPREEMLREIGVTVRA